MYTAKLPAWLIHTLATGLFITYEVSYLLLLGAPVTTWHLIPYYALALAVFYGNAYIVMPITERQRVLTILLLIVLEVSLYMLFMFFVAKAISLIPQTKRDVFKISPQYLDMIRNSYRAVYVIGLSTTYWLGRKTIVQAKEVNLLRVSKFEAEIAYLRAQSNPHLLFNLLNDLHEDLFKTSPVHAEKVSLISEMMQYAYRPVAGDQKSPLKEEIDNIQNLLKLQQSRQAMPLFLVLNCSQNHSASIRFLPLVLITLVENMMKYGVVDDPDDPAKIDITYENGILTVVTFNRIRKSVSHHSMHHIGLSNIRQRLNHAYPERYEMIIDKMEHYFKVTLNVQL